MTENNARIPARSYFFACLIIIVSIFTFPKNWSGTSVTWQHVWYYGWITAVATGLGAFPFFFVSKPNKNWMGISNAIAGGMMLAASHSLLHEGFEFQMSNSHGIDFSLLASWGHHHVHSKTALGFLMGLAFIVITKKLLEKHDDIHIGDIQGASAQRMILIVIVMTLHSLSEGVGIGVSFGGAHGMKLGSFISLSLAMHNVPEGLAVALAATSRKVPPLQAALWAIFTSLPQPITAVPAYLFVDRSIEYLPLGLGFAAGAMTFVAIFELLPESSEDIGIIWTGLVGAASFGVMSFAQEGMKGL